MVFIRLHKYIAHCGITSRRKAEDMIKDGMVTVNGSVISRLGFCLDPQSDLVKVNGTEIFASSNDTYIMLNKPTGYVTTVLDNKNRRTVMNLLHGVGVRVYPVGRLDYNTQGLLILTNDGDLAYRLTHPKFNVEKTYVVEVRGHVNLSSVRELRSGVFIENRRTKSAEVVVLSEANGCTQLQITISEGRNRQIRNMFGILGFEVDKLTRVREGSLSLGNLPLGKWRDLSLGEVCALKGL